MGGYDPDAPNRDAPPATAREAAAIAGAQVGFRGSYGGAGGQAYADYVVLQQQQRQQQPTQVQSQLTWEQKSRLAAGRRPGYTDASQLGDQNTQRRYQQLQAANRALRMAGYPEMPVDTLMGTVLESQRKHAESTPGTRDDQFFSGELQKWMQNKVELSSAYHHVGKAAGVPIPENPFEMQGDLALEVLKGAPNKRSEFFSPVSGRMSQYLPGYDASTGTGGLGIQQHAWNTARDGRVQPVSFMPAIETIGSSYGGLMTGHMGAPTGANRSTGTLPGGDVAKPFMSFLQPSAGADPFRSFVSGFGFVGNQTAPAAPTPDKGTVDFLRKFAGFAPVAGMTSYGYGSASLPGAFSNPVSMELMASNPIGWGLAAGGLGVIALEGSGMLGLFGEGRVRQAGADYAESQRMHRSTGGAGGRVVRMSESGTGMFTGNEAGQKSRYSEIPPFKSVYSEIPAKGNRYSEIPPFKSVYSEVGYGVNKGQNKNRPGTGNGNAFIDDFGQQYPPKNPTRNPPANENPFGDIYKAPTDTGNPYKGETGFPTDTPYIWQTPNPNKIGNPFEPFRGYDYGFPSRPSMPKTDLRLPNIIIPSIFGGSSGSGAGYSPRRRGMTHREIIPLSSWLSGGKSRRIKPVMSARFKLW